MKTAIARLKSVSPLQYSRYYGEDEAPRKPDESDADYYGRTWRNRAHFNEKGECFIPPMMFKKSLEEAAKFASERVEGKGMSTWTKHFEAGVLVVQPLMVKVHKDKMEGLTLFVPSDGKKGGGRRVHRTYPILRNWEGDVEYMILDDRITEDVFTRTLKESGKLIGIGAFRPRNGGYFGRFDVVSVKWSEGV